MTKLEARLRFAGLSYKTEAGSPRTAPKGKIPYVEISRAGHEPEMIADSSQIIGRLVEDDLLPDLNADLDPVEMAHDMALRALLEEKLYFYQVHLLPIDECTMLIQTIRAMKNGTNITTR